MIPFLLVAIIAVIVYFAWFRAKLRKHSEKKAQTQAQLNAHPDALAVRLDRFAAALQLQAEEAQRLANEAMGKAQQQGNEGQQ